MSGLVATDLRALIQSTLSSISLYSPAAEELLMATCAQESLLGEYRHQVNGPALGIFQMEPGDHNDIWENFLAYHSVLAAAVASLSKDSSHPASELENNDAYAIAMCRVHFLRSPHPLPAPTDLLGLWTYYKTNYNSVKGAATEDEFLRHYQLTGGAAT